MITNLIALNINSSKQNILSGTSDNFNYLLNVPADKINHVTNVSLVSCSLPKSFYQINELNNSFTLIENGTPLTINIIPGNYILSSWFSTLSSLLTAASLLGVTYTVVFQYSYNDNGIMKITASNSSYSYVLQVPNSSISGVLGFDRNNSYSFTNGVLLSLYVINLNESDMIYINSNIISSEFNDATNLSSNTMAIMYTGSYRNYSYIT